MFLKGLITVVRARRVKATHGLASIEDLEGRGEEKLVGADEKLEDFLDNSMDIKKSSLAVKRREDFRD